MGEKAARSEREAGAGTFGRENAAFREREVFLMARCSAITQSGTHCRQSIVDRDGLCAAHGRGVREAAPRPPASRGGPALALQPAPMVAAGYRTRLEEIADRLLDSDDTLGTKSAAAAVAALNAALRSLVIEADLRERGELEPRLKRLEEARSWGR